MKSLRERDLGGRPRRRVDREADEAVAAKVRPAPTKLTSAELVDQPAAFWEGIGPGKLSLEDVGRDDLSPEGALAYAETMIRERERDAAGPPHDGALASAFPLDEAATSGKSRSGRLARTLYQRVVADPGPSLFRDALPGAPTSAVPKWVLEAITAATRRPGQALPDELRRRLEAELHADLRDVRMFGGAGPAMRELGARAVTIGRSVVLGDDAPAIGTSEGDRLIAHEAFHAVHHAAPANDAAHVSEPGDAEEHDARAFADRFEDRRRRDPGAAARAAIDVALARAGVDVAPAHRDLLATYYGEGIMLSSWALGSDRASGGALLGAMLTHCEHHAGCGHQPARPPVASTEPRADQALDEATRRAVEHTTGRPLGDVVVRRDAAVAERGRLGEAIGRVIRLAPEVPGPDTALGRDVLLHEAAHVAQQDAAPAPPERGREAAESKDGASRAEVEADAHAVADAAAAGEQRAPEVRAEADQAYGLGVGDVIGAAADALGIDPMAWLAEFAPELAAFVNNGFDPILRLAGEAAAGVVRPILDAIDVTGLTQKFTDWVARMQKESLAFGLLTGCCECLGGALGSVLTTVQGALASPLADQIRDFMSSMQAGGNSWLGDQIQGVTDFATGTIDGIIRLYEGARAILGPPIQEVWVEIAKRLKLDASLSPYEAIKKKLQELWDQVMVELEPARRALEEAWQILCDKTFVGDIVRFVGDCQRLVRAIRMCQDARTRDPARWLAILAREMKGTIFEGLITDLQSGHDASVAAGQAVERWVVRLLEKLGIIKAWNTVAPAIAAIGQALQAFARKVEAAINEIRRLVTALMAAVSKAFRDLYEAIRPLLNFVVGLGIAIAATYAGHPEVMVLFLLGNLWLHILPDCYKEALADVVLDIMISVFEWLPATFPLVVIIRAAALGFLHTMRAAPLERKISAMDLTARLWAGDFEFAAGLVVGFFKGLWESTPGLILRLGIFTTTLPFRILWEGAQILIQLTSWGVDQITSHTEWLVDLMSRAQGIEVGEDGTISQGPLAEPEEETGGTSSETEYDPADIQPAPAEDEDAEGVTSTDPATEGPLPDGNENGDNENTPDDGAIEDPVWEPLPPFGELGSFAAILESIRDGISRESIDKFLQQFNLNLEAMGKEVGEGAATAFMDAMTARSLPYNIGEVVGTVIGFLTGEIAMLFIPGIGEVAVALGKIGQFGGIALKALRSFPLFIRALEALKVAIAPIWRFMVRFGDELGRIGKAIAKYFDDLIAWARRQLDNLMRWVERNFPRLRRFLRRGLRRLLGGNDLDDIAEEAAEDAWDALYRQLDDGVVTEAQLEQKLRTIRVDHPHDVRIRLQILARRSSWGVKATASKAGETSKSATEGSGWVTTEWHEGAAAGPAWYAPYADWFNHWHILERAEDDILEWNAPDTTADWHAGYAALQEKLLTEQREGQRSVDLRGIQFQFSVEDEREAERDDTIGIQLVITPNARSKWVYLPKSHLFPSRYMGARRVGDEFEGHFGHGDWNWGAAAPNHGVPRHGTTYEATQTADFPRHPVNAYRSAGYQYDQARMPMPTGPFRHGGSTPSWDMSSWQRHLRTELSDRMTEDSQTEDQAKAAMVADYGRAPYTYVTDWAKLYFESGHGWEGHHVKESSWNGADEESNIIAIPASQHRPFTTWWEARAREIKAALGIITS